MIKTFNVLIYGLGNIGKSYLKGLLNSKQNLNIYTLDINKNLYKFILRKNKKKIFNFYKLNNLPKKIDLCIVSTTSDNKVEQLKNIFKYTFPKNIILEKLIAQSEAEIDLLNKIFDKKKCKVWVNTQMRTYSFYKKLKKYIQNKKPKFIKVYGNDWGFACNSIHYLDVYSWILSSDIKNIKLKTSNKKFYKSKRKGYLEFFGSYFVELNNKIKIQIICKKLNKQGKINHIIELDKEKIYINEAKSIIYNSTGNLMIKANQKMIFEQINFFVSKIIKKQDLNLPKLQSSSILHKKIFSAINTNFFRSDNKSRKLKIT